MAVDETRVRVKGDEVLARAPVPRVVLAEMRAENPLVDVVEG